MCHGVCVCFNAATVRHMYATIIRVYYDHLLATEALVQADVCVCVCVCAFYLRLQIMFGAGLLFTDDTHEFVMMTLCRWQINILFLETGLPRA